MAHKSNIAQKKLITLAVANALPLLGVLFLQWDVETIFLIYWVELVVLSIFDLIKIKMAHKTFGNQYRGLAMKSFGMHIFSIMHLFYIFAFGFLLLYALQLEGKTPTAEQIISLLPRTILPIGAFVINSLMDLINFREKYLVKQTLNVLDVIGHPSVKAFVNMFGIMALLFLSLIFNNSIFALLGIILANFIVDLLYNSEES
jgi:hypothetical protein